MDVSEKLLNELKSVQRKAANIGGHKLTRWYCVTNPAKTIINLYAICQKCKRRVIIEHIKSSHYDNCGLPIKIKQILKQVNISSKGLSVFGNLIYFNCE